MGHTGTSRKSHRETPSAIDSVSHILHHSWQLIEIMLLGEEDWLHDMHALAHR